MTIQTISKIEANEIIGRQESHYFDLKSIDLQPAKLQKYVTSFANADGGQIVIGIEDDKTGLSIENRWKGYEKIEDFNGILQSLMEIRPTISFKTNFYACQDYTGIILNIEIDKSNSVHQCSDGKVYERVGAQSLPIVDQQRIQQLTFAKGAVSYEDANVKGIPLEIIVDSPILQQFLKYYSPKTHPLDFVVNQQFCNLKTWEPSIAGLLLFSENPSNQVPRQCAIKIARYETKEDEPEREHLKETYTIEGALINQINEASDKIKSIMSSISIWTLDGLKTVDYPPEAIWEVLVNAVIHRDYSISDNIQIHIYNNRIEIISPGRLPGYVTLFNILDSRFSRNPKIVRSLNRFQNPPNKDMGEGLNTTFQKMKEWRLKEPILEEDGNYFKVIIPHASLAKPEEIILEFLSKSDTIKNSQARDLTGIRSENSMKNVFYKLRDEGLIERVPGLEGKSAAWQLKKSNNDLDEMN